MHSAFDHAVKNLSFSKFTVRPSLYTKGILSFDMISTHFNACKAEDMLKWTALLLCVPYLKLQLAEFSGQ